MSIAVRGLSLGYGKGETHHTVFDNFHLEIEASHFTCVLGPSGCGKSSLLQAIAGFRTPARGTISVPGTPAVVFQKHNLFPWKTALENIALGLRSQGASGEEACREAQAGLTRVGLDGLAQRYPRELSLGQQQRVGIARAFSLRAPVLLMDEPFGSLDAQTRLKMQGLLLEIWNKEKPTVVFITHDIDEAVLLGDRVVVLQGAPAEIRGDFSVKAARPRRFLDLATPELASLRQEIFRLL